MGKINIYNSDGRVLTSKIINQINKAVSTRNGENITFIIQNSILIKIEE